MSAAGARPRRIPRRRMWWFHLMVALFVPLQAWTTLVTPDLLYRVFGVCSVVGAALGYAAVLRWAAPARHVGELPGASLPVVLRAAPRPAYALVVACVLGLVAVVSLVIYDLQDPSTTHRKVVFGVILPLYALPTLLRLVTGRLRLWFLHLDADGLHYRGGRHDRYLPWSEVRGVHHDQRHHRMRVVAGSRKRDLDMPLLVFDHPPEEIVDLVTSAWRGGRSR